MDVALGGILIMAVMLGGVVVMSRAVTTSDVVTGVAIREVSELTGERVRTEISFVTSTVSGSNLTVDVENTGNTSITAYTRMDLIVDYIRTGGGPSGTQNVERLAYVASSPRNLEWTDLSLTPDTYQPGIWDPGETLRMDADLNPPKTGDGNTNTVWVSTPNGVVTVGIFYVP